MSSCTPSSTVFGRRFVVSARSLGSDLPVRRTWFVSVRRPWFVVAGRLGLLDLVPDTAWAWTPGTHVFLGDAVLRAATMLPGNIGELLRAFPHEFLYGSIAADTSIAKKYAPAGRHCHSWAVGFEIYDAARDEPLR